MRLIIDVENKTSGDMWRGDFQAKYVEEITNKAGLYKKFSVFVKMILSALKAQGDQANMSIDTQLNSGVSLNLLSQ
jgi:coiled-coil domain-containing protein 61